MWLRTLAISSLTLALGGCLSTGSNAPASVAAECKVFDDPGFQVYGATRKDQRWVATTQEKGIGVCGWKRPAARTVTPQAVTNARTPAKKRRWFGA